MPERDKKFPWYDSPWLTIYLIAKDFVQENFPQKYDEFVHAFDVFRTPSDFSVMKVPKLFDDDVLHELQRLISQLEHRDAPRDELLTFGRFVKWDLPYVTDLQHRVTDRVSELVGEAVEPSYNFLSLYKEMGVCHVHMDAPFAKWTVDYCIEQSAMWPIHFSQVVPWPEDWMNPGNDWQEAIKNDPANKFVSYEMNEGEALIFSGSSQWHYRNAIERTLETNFCHLLFLHFIPAGTADLKVPANWKDLFDIPELGELKNPTSSPILNFK